MAKHPTDEPNGESELDRIEWLARKGQVTFTPRDLSIIFFGDAIRPGIFGRLRSLESAVKLVLWLVATCTATVITDIVVHLIRI